MSEEKRSRRWCLTLNNWTEVEYELVKDYMNKCLYGIIGKEIGEKGTPHLQCYFELKNATRLDTLKKMCNRGHFEVAKGNQEQNYKYCSKEGNYVEFGTRSKTGKRSDLEKVKKLVEEGKSIEEIIDSNTSIAGLRIVEKIMTYKEKKRDFKPYVMWIYGPTGTGKTRKAFESCAGKRTWVSGRNLQWWDGYDAHECVIIDDFRPDFCTFHELLRILDRYEYRVPIKGGFRQLCAKYMIITSPKDPKKTYKNRTNEDINQLMRRIDNIIFLGYDTETRGELGNTD